MSAPGVPGAPGGAAGLLPPSSGLVEGGWHRFRLRVYYEDTDAAGIVYFANYQKFAERARTELLRLTGVEQSLLSSESGLGFAVYRCNVTLKSSARLDDILEVRSRVFRYSGARIDFVQRIMNGERLSAELDVGVACVDRTLRPRRVPAEVAERLLRILPLSREA